MASTNNTTSERRISYAVDVENGERPHRDTEAGDGAALDEYSALNRYISTARDGRRGSTSSAGALSDKGDKKKPWWKFWGKGGDSVEEGWQAPEEWIETDLRAGLSSGDIEPRRKKCGWNELTTEKTNIFIQFIGYFRGPILYGKFFSMPMALQLQL